MKAVLILTCILLSVQGSSTCATVTTDNPITAFFVGIYDGLQENPGSSYCVQNLGLIGNDWDTAMHQFVKFFETGNVNFVYTGLNKLNIWANNFDSAMTDCKFALLVNRIQELISLQEISAIATRIGLHASGLIQDWKDILEHFGKDNCEAGKAFGDFISKVLGYQL